jgi:uncharacterized membrane protein YdfJ with MMPL/SSD domain
VQRRPWLVAAGVSALLLVACALPFLQVNYGSGDPRILPRGAESRQVAQTLLADFPGKQASPIQVVARMTASDPRVAAYAAQLKDHPGVAAVSVEPGLHGPVSAINVTALQPPISFLRTDPRNFTEPSLSRAAQAKPCRGSQLTRRSPA